MTTYAAEPKPPERAQIEAVAYACFAILMISVIFLQKIGMTIGNIVVPIGLFSSFAVIAFLLSRGLGAIDKIQLCFYCIFVSLGATDIAVDAGSSLSSFLLVSALALPFVFNMPVSRYTSQRAMNLFVTFMLCTAPIVLVEWALQIVLRPGLWVNLDAVIPKALLVPGYMYRHPTAFQSPWMQPNAAVFLEVSILSQFLAIAIMIELSYSRRPLRLAILFFTMLITLGGSGPFMLALSSPLLLLYAPRRLLLPGIIFAGAVLIALSFTSVFSDFTGRIFEFQNAHGSAHGRYIVPLQVLEEQFAKGPVIFYGNGPGSGDAVGAGFSFNKLLYEYGLLATISYYVVFLRMLFKSGHPPLVIWALFLYFSFLGGGLGVPLYPLACMTLAGFLRVHPSPVEADQTTSMAHPQVANLPAKRAVAFGAAWRNFHEV
ncbi:MAG TPA: hypothetical protein VL418_05175 [Devosiaceae bacterium]|nr:hypothetical protein [Devosiaceae bacterium]